MPVYYTLRRKAAMLALEILIFFATVCGMEEENVIRLGIVTEGDVLKTDQGRTLQCLSNGWHRRTTIQTTMISYDTQNRSSLIQAAHEIVNTDVSVLYVSTADVYTLKSILYRHDNNDNSLSVKLNLNDMLWYIRVSENNPLGGTHEHAVFDACSNQQTVVQFIAGVISSIGWTHISLMYDSDYAYEASLVTDWLSVKDIMIYQYQIKANQSSLPFLQRSYHDVPIGWRHYLLMANEQSIDAIFEELNQFDEPGLSRTAMKTFSMWVVWSRDMTSQFLEQRVGNISNVAFLERPGCYKSNLNSALKLIHPLTCGCCDFVSGNYSSNSSDHHVQDVAKIIDSIWNRLMADNEALLVLKLSTALWKPNGRKFHVVFWNKKGDLNIKHKELFPNTQYGLNNMHLTVTTLEWELFVYSKKLPDGTIQYTGLCIDILIEASRKLNFSYTIKTPEDQEWGRQTDDGRWTGLIGDIVYKRADLQVACLSVQIERVAVMDFTTAFYTDYYNFILRMPDKEESRWKILLRPLNWKILMTIACVFPVVTMFVWICEKYSPYYNNVPERRRYPVLHHLDMCILYMFGALFTRSGDSLPRAMSGRTILSFWWLFVVLMVATYYGNLMAFLAVTRDKKPFTTIAGMLQQDQYKWGTNKGTYIFGLFQTSNDPEYRQVGVGMKTFAETEPDVMSVGLDGHAALLEKGNYVYIADSVIIDTLVKKKCDFVKGNEEFLMLQYSMGLPKDSAYTHMFTEQVRSFHEGGLIEMWTKRWSAKSIPCLSLLQTEAKKIMLIDIQSSFYVLIGGILIAAIICAIEMCHSASVLSKKIT